MPDIDPRTGVTKARYFEMHGLIDGSPEAEAAWAAKLAFVPIRLQPLVMRDIEPYQAMGTDIATGTAPWITSRSQHRDYIKRNNYVELGNDSSLQAPPKVNQEISDREIGKQVKQTIEQKGIRL